MNTKSNYFSVYVCNAENKGTKKQVLCIDLRPCAL